MAAVNIVCVYHPGNGLTDEYVYRLQAGVEQYMQAPYRFVCLTTRTLDGVECVPLQRGNKGWWNKLEIFRKGLFAGLTVYLDLDSIVIDDVTDMFTYPHEFTTGANWRGSSKALNKGVLNSGFMLWNADRDLSHLDIKVDSEIDEEYSHSPFKWGDQAYIQDHLGFDFVGVETLFPNRYVSYKIHVRRQGIVPPSASIVAFHGRPRPHEIDWRLPNGREREETPRDRALRASV
jgi:hypothetical protein